MFEFCPNEKSKVASAQVDQPLTIFAKSSV